MKKINIILSISIVLICFTSCSKFSKEEILISDYVQTSNGIKTDMKFKILEINEEENLISNRDSLVILLSEIKYNHNITKGIKIHSENSDFTYSKAEIDIIINNLKVNKDVISFFAFFKETRHKLDSIENVSDSLYEMDDSNLSYEAKMQANKMRIKTLEAEISTSKFLREAEKESRRYTETIEYIERLNQKEYEILLVPYYVKYEIHNPLLNSVKQEITKVFYFNGKRDRIIDITNVKKINKLEIPNSIYITSPWLKNIFN